MIAHSRPRFPEGSVRSYVFRLQANAARKPVCRTKPWFLTLYLGRAIGEECVAHDLRCLPPCYRVDGSEVEAGARLTRGTTAVTRDYAVQGHPLDVEPERAVDGYIDESLLRVRDIVGIPLYSGVDLG